MKQNNFDNTKLNFFEYLTNLGISSKSHKNYRSDLSHFCGWMILKARSFGSYIETLTEAVPFISQGIAKEYVEYMRVNKTPVKSVNRRLSTLRHFSKFLISSESLNFDFMNGIENISLIQKRTILAGPVITEFQGYLEASKVSKNTVKNYMSDVKQFFAWVEAQDHANLTN